MNTTDFVSDKMMTDLMKALFPQYFKTATKGRPLKKSLADSLRNAGTVAKIALTAVSAYSLEKKGLINREHLCAVVAYCIEHLDDVELVHVFPSSEKWVIKKALKEMGFRGEVKLTWDEIISELGTLATRVQLANVLSQLNAQTVVKGWSAEQVQQWVSQFQAQQSHVQQGRV